MYEISPVRRKGELAGEHACTRPQCERRSRRGTIGGLHRPFRTLLRPDTPGRCGEPVVRRRRGGRRTWRSDPRLAVGHPARRSRRRPGTARHHRHPRRGTSEPGENAAEGTARHRTIMDQGGVELFAPARRTRWYVEPFPARHAEIGLGVGHNVPSVISSPTVCVTGARGRALSPQWPERRVSAATTRPGCPTGAFSTDT